MSRRLISAFAISAVLAVAGCSPASAQTAAPAQSGSAGACQKVSQTATVSATVKDFEFSPVPIQAKVGDVVGWTNQGPSTHTVTLDDGTCDGGLVTAGSSVMLTFSAAGTYPYHCSIHPSMHGTVDVSG